MSINKILFPTKFRELALDSLEALVDLKKVGLKEVVLLHVIEREQVGFVPYGGYLKDEEERLREVADLKFEQWRAFLDSKGVGSKTHVVVGTPVPEILKLAEQEKVDFVVAGRKKKKGLEKVYFGSTMLHLLRESAFPVLAFKFMCEFREEDGEVSTRVNQRIFERPIIATDWSPASEAGLKYVVRFKGLIEELNVIHVLGEDLGKKRLQEARKAGEERLQTACDRLKKKGIKANSHICAGPLVEEIIRAASEHHSSLIVMGTTGKDRWKEFWLGSASHRIAEIAPLPVLLIP